MEITLGGSVMRGSHRAALGGLGLVVVLAGVVAWSIEDVYGSGLNFMRAPQRGRPG